MADDRNTPRRAAAGLMVIGSELVAFFAAGLLLDYLLGWMPWATVTMTLLGMTTAFVHLVRAATPRKPDGHGRSSPS